MRLLALTCVLGVVVGCGESREGSMAGGSGGKPDHGGESAGGESAGGKSGGGQAGASATGGSEAEAGAPPQGEVLRLEGPGANLAGSLFGSPQSQEPKTALARCRLISRYRVDYSRDSATRLGFGPTLLEPISFVMDRRMLPGVKERAERQARCA